MNGHYEFIHERTLPFFCRKRDLPVECRLAAYNWARCVLLLKCTLTSLARATRSISRSQLQSFSFDIDYISLSPSTIDTILRTRLLMRAK